jgi:hypothetical protein
MNITQALVGLAASAVVVFVLVFEWKKKQPLKHQLVINEIITSNTALAIIRKVQDCAKNGPNYPTLQLVLQTHGGSASATLRIAQTLQAYPGRVDTWIPRYAYSGGTLLALSVLHKGRLYMGPLSSVSTLDLQRDLTNGVRYNRNVVDQIRKDGVKPSDAVSEFTVSMNSQESLFRKLLTTSFTESKVAAPDEITDRFFNKEHDSVIYTDGQCREMGIRAVSVGDSEQIEAGVFELVD